MAGMVSICIPSYNRAKFLPETLQSVLNQTYREFEIIVVDDGSTDNSLDVGNKFATQHRQVHILERQTFNAVKGACACRNLAMDQSRGEFILFLDSDDLLAPDCLRGRVEALQNSPELDFCVGRCEQFLETPGDSPGVYWGEEDTQATDLERFLGLGKIPWQTAGPLYRREFLLQNHMRWAEAVKRAQDMVYGVYALLHTSAYKKLDRLDHYWRAPGENAAMSGLNQRKEADSDGELLHALLVCLGYVTSSDYLQINRRYRRAGLIALIRQHLSQARLFGASSKLCREYLNRYRKIKVLTPNEWLLLHLSLLLWFRIGAKNPGMALMARVGPPVKISDQVLD